MDRLRWACQRAQSELSIPLTFFLDYCYADLKMAQRFAFERLLAASDTEISNWLANHSQPRDQGVCIIIEAIQQISAETG